MLLITPGQLARRAEFYHQIGQLTSAGLGLIRALEQLQRSPPDRSYRPPLQRLLKRLAEGYSFSEALRTMGPWLPEIDIALIQAGEQSGRLESCFRLLADYYNDRARLARQMIANLAYPVGLLHFAIFIFPFPTLFISGDWVTYLTKTFGVLVPIYALVAAFILAA